MTTKTILSILGVVGLIIGALFLAGFMQRSLFILPLTYGLAGSLDNLQNQSIAELNYSNELHGYIKSHNITCCLNFNEMEDYQLEPIVKRHMQECQSGHHDYMVNYTKNMTSGSPLLKDTEKEILGSYGDC